MIELKPLSKEAIPKALEKALRYRLLNDPWQAESICRDILNAEPDNQEARYMLILSITDRFGSKLRTELPQVIELIAQLDNEYRRNYCHGLVYERQAMAAFKGSGLRAGYIAYQYLQQAMEWYEKAEEVRPERNEESILRWNACARMIMQYKLQPEAVEKGIQPFLDV